VTILGTDSMCTSTPCRTKTEPAAPKPYRAFVGADHARASAHMVRRLNPPDCRCSASFQAPDAVFSRRRTPHAEEPPTAAQRYFRDRSPWARRLSGTSVLVHTLLLQTHLLAWTMQYENRVDNGKCEASLCLDLLAGHHCPVNSNGARMGGCHGSPECTLWVS
jgi:hypothetical protein